MGAMNRDWQRIVAYNSAYNYNYGYASSVLKYSEEKITYVQAISQPDACKYCRALLSGKIFILTDDASKLGMEAPKGSPANGGYMVVGSTNIGNKPVQYIPTIPLHPHCRCKLVEWFIEFAELEDIIT